MMADQNIRIVAFKKYRLRHSGISSEIIALKIEIFKTKYYFFILYKN